MSIALFFKVLALVLWFLAMLSPRVVVLNTWGGSLVAGGLFFWFAPDLLPL